MINYAPLQYFCRFIIIVSLTLCAIQAIVVIPTYIMLLKSRFLSQLLQLVLQSSAAELQAEAESIRAAAEQQQEPAASEPCGRTVTDNLDQFCGSTFGRYDPTLTDAERQWIARYPCIDGQQLAELREAFLMFAVGAQAMTPRTAETVVDSARLDVTDIGACLRAVGLNPTQADIARITAIAASRQQRQEPEDGGGLTSAAASSQAVGATSSNRAVFQAATKQPAAAGRVLTATSDVMAISRPSVAETPTSRVSDSVYFRS